MAFNEIKELRQAGKLAEALQLATQTLESDPDNIWNKRAIGWVYYEYLKLNVLPENSNEFLTYLQNLHDLQLPPDEKMIFDSCAWQIGKLVFSFTRENPLRLDLVDQIFEIVKYFHFSKPAEAYSFLYKAFHKAHVYGSGYIAFADWWNFDNFLPEDYQESKYNGKKTMSIVEQAYIAYAKKLLEGEDDPFMFTKRIDKEKIKHFLPKLDHLIENRPEYQYPTYFKAKLLLALGGNENVFEVFLPFAKKKRNNFWIWEIISEIYLSNPELHFSCLCKALSLRTPDEFLIKLRQKIVPALIERRLFNEAKTEIETILHIRNKNDWRIPNVVTNWTNQDWYSSAVNLQNNKKLYEQHLAKAEALLFQDVPEEFIAVEFVNENKTMLNFVKDQNMHGFFNYKDKIKNPEIGDVLKVRFVGPGKDGYYKVLSAQKVNDSAACKALRTSSGKLKLIDPPGFGFIDDIFIDAKMIERQNLKDGDTIKVKALLSFNKKKNEWGWKGLEVNKDS